VPVLDFLAIGKDFIREHRCCPPPAMINESVAALLRRSKEVTTPRETGDE
jgi:hypothetical protein